MSNRGMRGRIVGRIMLAGLTVALLGGLVAIFIAGRRQHGVVVKLNNNAGLKLETAITKNNPVYETTTWREKIYDALPERFAEMFLPDSWPLGGVNMTAPSLEPGTVRFVFSPAKLQGLHDTAAQYAAVKEALSDKPVYMRLKYGPGLYSEPKVVNEFYTVMGKSGAEFALFETDFSGVPLNQKAIELETYQNFFDESTRRLVQTDSIANPVYDAVESLESVTSLPATICRDGLCVTLQALVSRTVDITNSHEALDDKKPYPDLEKFRFLRAEGTPEDPYGGGVTLTVNEENSSTTGWEVKTVNFSYGKPNIPISPSGVTTQQHETTSGLTQYFGYNLDFAIVDQPIKISALVGRRSGFPADEIATVDLTIPTTGTSSKPRELSFWNGELLLEVGNQVRMKDDNHGNAAECLNIKLTGPSVDTFIKEVILQADDHSTQSLRGYQSGSSTTFGTQLLKIESYRSSAWGTEPPVDFSRFTTAILTIVSPRRIEKAFEFVAVPTQAQVPSRKVKYE